MATAPPGWADAILRFWFEECGTDDWFSGSDALDRAIVARFEPILLELAGERAGTFLTDPGTALAAIVLFDQFPRNLYRHEARAFAFDHLARELSHAFIERQWDNGLPDSQRQFVAMPLMHSENLADQETSLAYFGRHLPANLPFARSHHEMIARFGRFPHRNAALGRATTAEEQRAIDEGFSW